MRPVLDSRDLGGPWPIATFSDLKYGHRPLTAQARAGEPIWSAKRFALTVVGLRKDILVLFRAAYRAMSDLLPTAFEKQKPQQDDEDNRSAKAVT
jgi:hypothetical protein